MFRIFSMTETPANLPQLAQEVRTFCPAIGLITVGMVLALLTIVTAP